MTREEKQILLRDLCGRSLYGVKGLHRGKVHELFIIDGREVNSACIQVDGYDAWFPVETFKPYLRPLSSMTEEEKKEFQACHCVYELHPDFQPMMCNLANELNMFNWLNAHHFDYRGLIDKGLALEAHEGMYENF